MASDASAASEDYSYDEELATAADAAAVPTRSQPAFVFLDPLLSDAGREALEQGLGVPLRALHPAEFEQHPVQPSDLAVVVALDLGLLSGIDAVEQLRRGGCRCPIALASAKPTRALVRAAQRAGATTVISQPYDLEELRRRLLVGTSAAALASSDAADPAAGVSA